MLSVEASPKKPSNWEFSVLRRHFVVKLLMYALALLSVEVIVKQTSQRRYWNSVLIANKLLLIPDIPCHAGSMHERRLEKNSGRVILHTDCK